MRTATAGGRCVPSTRVSPGVNAPPPATFDEFDAFHLSQHLHPRTRSVAVTGMTVGWLSVVAAIVLAQPWLVLGASLFGYGGAIPSHYIWEHNKPASFLGVRPFLWSIGGDLRQFAGFYGRRLDRDVVAVACRVWVCDPTRSRSPTPPSSPPPPPERRGSQRAGDGNRTHVLSWEADPHTPPISFLTRTPRSAPPPLSVAVPRAPLRSIAYGTPMARPLLAAPAAGRSAKR